MLHHRTMYVKDILILVFIKNARALKNIYKYWRYSIVENSNQVIIDPIKSYQITLIVFSNITIMNHNCSILQHMV